MDGGSLSLSAALSAFQATLRVASGVYELKAVGEQTRDLLDSTEHVLKSLQVARTIRHKKSTHLDSAEKKWIDDVLANTEKTLNNVAALIEPARVDMQTKFGRIGLLNRGLFVFRDSPKVATNLARLNLASQSLNAAMNILCTREGHTSIHSPNMEPLTRKDHGLSIRDTLKAPPPYEESEFLNRRRSNAIEGLTITPTNHSRVTSNYSIGSATAGLPEPNVNGLGISDLVPSYNGELLENFTGPYRTCEDKIPVEPVVTKRETLPSPNGEVTLNDFEGSDGLQVCERLDMTENAGQGVLMFEGAPGTLDWLYQGPQHGQTSERPNQRMNTTLGQKWQNQPPCNSQLPPSQGWNCSASQERQRWPSPLRSDLSSPSSPRPETWEQQQHAAPSPVQISEQQGSHSRQGQSSSPPPESVHNNKQCNPSNMSRQRSAYSLMPSRGLDSTILPAGPANPLPNESFPHSLRSYASSSRLSTASTLVRSEDQTTDSDNWSRRKNRRRAWLEYQSKR